MFVVGVAIGARKKHTDAADQLAVFVKWNSTRKRADPAPCAVGSKPEMTPYDSVFTIWSELISAEVKYEEETLKVRLSSRFVSSIPNKSADGELSAFGGKFPPTPIRATRPGPA